MTERETAIAERELVFKNWKEALLSGEYKQGKNALYKDGKYCCLGVLCEVVGLKRNQVDGPAFQVEDDNSKGMVGTKFLPDVVACLLGMDSWGILKNHTSNSLVAMNDNGASFELIAEQIDNIRTCDPLPVNRGYKLEGGKIVRAA